ncbi:MAG: hypothetical protein II894_00790, partial [Bacteroidales bacterium]|nr:hypothetical protein [Bacteroidales bacterium]
ETFAAASEYKPKGRMRRTLMVRNCADAGVSAECFRKCLHHYISDALAVPEPEKFEPSSNGMTLVSEADIVQMCLSRKRHKMPKGNYYTVADAAIAFGLSSKEDD